MQQVGQLAHLHCQQLQKEVNGDRELFSTFTSSLQIQAIPIWAAYWQGWIRIQEILLFFILTSI
jgi:hypothetical protein